MVFFKKKNAAEQIQPIADKNVQRTFQIGAVFLLGFVIYSLYFDDSSKVPGKNSLSNLTEEQLNARVKQAFEQMSENPEYKKIKDFILYIETNVDGKSAKVLDAKNGVLIYLPEKMLENNSGKVEISEKNVNISISSEKKTQTDVKPAENSASQQSQ